MYGITALIIAAIILVPLLVVIGIYNSLVKLRQQVRESWSGIDTELKRRYDLIPNLIETVKGYAKHEREVFEKVTEARTKAINSTGAPGSQAADENMLVGALRQLFAVAENYPELKASERFGQLQSELANTENRIQAARRFYNGNVREINAKVQMFPSNIIASMFGFTQEEYFEIEDLAMRETPKVAF
jgi:LemA protein